MTQSHSATFYPARSRSAHIGAWLLQFLLAFAFLAAAAAKLIGVAMMVDSFAAIGLGQGFRYLTAIVELVGAVALLAPRVCAYGALWLALTMIGATVAHVTRLHTSPAPALVLLAACLVLAWLRRDQLTAIQARLR